MARSLKKGPYLDEKLLIKVERLARTGEHRSIKTWSRRSMIVPEFVGHSFSIHNGKTFITAFVTENMVGHRLGEFAPTRIFKGHSAHTDKTKAKK